MNVIVKSILNCFGRGLIRQYRMRVIRKNRAFHCLKRQQERDREVIEYIRGVKRFPVLELTEEKFKALPRGKGIDLKTCRLGTYFLCRSPVMFPSAHVVGQVVRGDQMFSHQRRGRSVPERGMRYFRLKVV